MLVTWPLSQRIHSFKPSATVNISNLAAQMQAEGRDVINLAVGEPDFDTPSHVIDAAMHGYGMLAKPATPT